MDPSETALPARPFPCCSVAEGVVVTLDGPLAAPGFAPQGLRRALHARARLILEKAKKVAGGLLLYHAAHLHPFTQLFFKGSFLVHQPISHQKQVKAISTDILNVQRLSCMQRSAGA